MNHYTSVNSYSYSVACADCQAAWHVGHMTVSLPLRFADSVRYFCPRCFLEVVLPGRVEARLLQALSDEQTDAFGNPSPFRARLAQLIKPYAQGSRRYALVTIPEFEIACPEDDAPLEIWRNYPEDPSLLCPKCGSRACQAASTGEIAHGVLTFW